ncbi:hypothetical protein ACFCV3_04355 [Kribbella sp. NPDC056345]|uniref:hypothetical protein n=1 Tax=Kribbella sp. NPDC056345 TaxID=3345789 RepID=UPI0035D606D8
MAPKHAPDNPRARTVDRVLTRLGSVVTSVVYPLVAVGFLVFVIVDLPSMLRVAHDEGIAGTFTVTRKECRAWYEKGGCSTYGDFVSTDGTIRRTNVLFENNPGRVGTQVPGQYLREDPPMIYAQGSGQWKFSVAIGVAAIGYLGYRLWRLVRRRPATSETDE